MSRPSGPRRRVYLIRHAQEDAEKRDGELQGPLTDLGAVRHAEPQDDLPAPDRQHSLERSPPGSSDRKNHRPPIPGSPGGGKLAPPRVRSFDSAGPGVRPAVLPHRPGHDSADARADRPGLRCWALAPSLPSHDIIVTHGNLIRALVVRLLGADEHAWIDMECRNCSLTTIDAYGDGRRVLVGFNDVGHLENGLRTHV